MILIYTPTIKDLQQIGTLRLLFSNITLYFINLFFFKKNEKEKRSVPTVPIDTYVLDFIRPSQKEVCQFAANLLPIGTLPHLCQTRIAYYFII
jgi:hypothetical protein